MDAEEKSVVADYLAHRAKVREIEAHEREKRSKENEVIRARRLEKMEQDAKKKAAEREALLEMKIKRMVNEAVAEAMKKKP